MRSFSCAMLAIVLAGFVSADVAVWGMLRIHASGDSEYLHIHCEGERLAATVFGNRLEQEVAHWDARYWTEDTVGGRRTLPTDRYGDVLVRRENDSRVTITLPHSRVVMDLKAVEGGLYKVTVGDVLFAFQVPLGFAAKVDAVCSR